ncbi:MAG TPA: hypothetical protein RMH99_14305 [Sandaracinaceae bacterium LLY-WYZ-13_1]|nr:hypothetical protein [Sandaracinaceae bacterium LLY-WYZ-13_1]
MKISTPVLASALALAALAACDGDPPPVPMRDAGRRDAGPGAMDARVPDAALPDGGGGRDGEVPDRDAGSVGCTVSAENVYKLATDVNPSERNVGLAATSNGFGVVWNETREGRPDLFGIRIASDGTLGGEVRLTDTAAIENPPSLIALGTEWLAAWVDNTAATGFEVRAQGLASDLSPTGSPSDLTSTAALFEDNPTLFAGSDGALLAWVQDDMVASTRQARARPLASDGSPSGSAQDASASDATPGQLALAELSGGPVLVWAEATGGTGDVILQPLADDGGTRGSSEVISAEGNADGTVDAALGPSGGAVVFGTLVGGVRSEIRFRALDEDGGLVGDERILTEAPVQGRGASIARFAGGYAVAYRRFGAGEGAAVQLLLVSALGDVLDEIEVATVPEQGGRTTLRVSGDGQIGIAWSDRGSTETQIRAAVVACGSGA